MEQVRIKFYETDVRKVIETMQNYVPGMDINYKFIEEARERQPKLDPVDCVTTNEPYCITVVMIAKDIVSYNGMDLEDDH